MLIFQLDINPISPPPAVCFRWSRFFLGLQACMWLWSDQSESQILGVGSGIFQWSHFSQWHVRKQCVLELLVGIMGSERRQPHWHRGKWIWENSTAENHVLVIWFKLLLPAPAWKQTCGQDPFATGFSYCLSHVGRGGTSAAYDLYLKP